MTTMIDKQWLTEQIKKFAAFSQARIICHICGHT